MSVVADRKTERLLSARREALAELVHMGSRSSWFAHPARTNKHTAALCPLKMEAQKASDGSDGDRTEIPHSPRTAEADVDIP